MPLFKDLDGRPLKALCRRAIPEVYSHRDPKNPYILKAEEPIKKVILIVNGEMCSYKKEDGTDGVPPQKHSVEYLGDEILSRDMTPKSSSSSKIRTSPIHIKAVTKVEAFTLTAKDWRDVYSEFEGHLYASEMRTWADSVLVKKLKERRVVKKIEKFYQDSRNNRLTRQQGAST